MYEIEFYEDSAGYSEMAEFIKELRRKSTTNKERNRTGKKEVEGL